MKKAGYDKSEPQTIQKMFGSIAKRYDRANAVMSFNLHKIWNRSLIDKVLEGSSNGKRMLDLCAGTGDIAFGFLQKHTSPCSAILLDFCPEMLECAKLKGKFKGGHSARYIVGDAQHVPLKNDSVDYVTIAYGIRNVKEPQKCISECFRVLDKGGTLGILELTKPENLFLRAGHSMYLRGILPVLGRFVTSNQQAYEYLCNSIHTFIPPTQLMEMVKTAGFSKIQRTPLSGGIATIITAKKTSS